MTGGFVTLSKITCYDCLVSRVRWPFLAGDSPPTDLAVSPELGLVGGLSVLFFGLRNIGFL